MTAWFERDLSRLDAERRRLQALAESATWLRSVTWRLAEHLYIDVVVEADARLYELRLSFPSVYPHAPPTVRPLNEQQRLSSHQYGGPDGPLCLEYGPDNWLPEFTAADVIESAYGLIVAESEGGGAAPVLPVPSRHRLTSGQRVRGEQFRWLQTIGVETFLKAQPLGSKGPLRHSLRYRGAFVLVLVHSGIDAQGVAWHDAQLPTALPECSPDCLIDGYWLRAPVSVSRLRSSSSVAEIRSLLQSNLPTGLDGEPTRPVSLLIYSDLA